MCRTMLFSMCFHFSSCTHTCMLQSASMMQVAAGVCVNDFDAVAWSCGRQPDAHKLICTHDELRREDDKRVRATGTCLHGNRRQDDVHLFFLPTTCQIRLTLCPSSLTSEISLSFCLALIITAEPSDPATPMTLRKCALLGSRSKFTLALY